jgi:hypothetical protein
VLTVVNTAVGVARGGDRLVGRRQLDVHVEVPPERVRLPDGLRQNGWLPAIARVEHPTSKQLVLSGAIDLSQAALFITGLWLLRGIASSVRRGDPFNAANVRRLRGIGFLLILGAPVAALLNWSLQLQLSDALPPGRFGNIGTTGFSLPGNALLAGLGVFILAEVFAHGLRLREDVEGTV